MGCGWGEGVGVDAVVVEMTTSQGVIVKRTKASDVVNKVSCSSSSGTKTAADRRTTQDCGHDEKETDNRQSR